ncbi:uncharacterized protein LOC128557019 [Mercenaria mercenaria]|uniref:uncharacterized protein LOC128557019 n=1 Tax=Mercenaria mercenaria TaxID=6596 RepID=UPI00234EC717|nr:uncharacterized protein LOC128557019 [Mercenaria mercenaria]
MATTTPGKPPDQLVDILKQIQARKTVKPEDATKALQQYYKVQAHIKTLKSEIELFKTSQEKQDVQAKSQAQGNSVVTRKNSIRSQGAVTKQAIPGSKTTPRTINSSSQMNGTVPIPSRGTKLPCRVSMNGQSKTQDRQPSNKATKDEKFKEDKFSKDEKQLSAGETTDKDKELARLRLQNAQMKVTLENKSNKGPNSVLGSENTTKSTILEQRDIPAPGKLVEEFKKIYEIEYKTAYHDLEKHYKLKEENITELLAGIAKEAYTFSINTSKQQFDDVTKAHAHVIDVLVQPKYALQVKDTITPKSKSIIDKDGYQITRRFLKDYRRAMAKVPIPGLIEIFETLVQRDVLSRFTALRITPKATKPYIHRLVEINWFMSIHEPQLAQVWPRGGQLMNRDWFTPYGKKGATVIHTVWPALFYHKEGTLAERGICLVK